MWQCLVESFPASTWFLLGQMRRNQPLAGYIHVESARGFIWYCTKQLESISINKKKMIETSDHSSWQFLPLNKLIFIRGFTVSLPQEDEHQSIEIFAFISSQKRVDILFAIIMETATVTWKKELMSRFGLFKRRTTLSTG